MDITSDLNQKNITKNMTLLPSTWDVQVSYP